MADIISRHEPVPTEPFKADGVTIALAEPKMRYSLRARDAAKLEKVIGSALPRTIGQMEGDVICLGPDEWLLRTANTRSVARYADGGGALSVVDVSERSIGITIDGPRVVDVLLSGSPLDLAKFAVGRATRTIFEGVEIILIRADQERFELDVWRSFAPFVWGVLVKAGGEL